MRKETRKKLRHLYRNLFIGRHSTIILIGFTTGGMIMGRSIWEYLFETIGLGRTFLVGLVIFVITGLYMHQFYDTQEEE